MKKGNMQKNNLNYKTANSFSMNAILIIGLAILLTANIFAATVTVTNTNDSGAGSLRQAISSAASGDTINFNLAGCPCTIALTSAELLIDRKNLFITGPGANQLTISGGGARRIFRITGIAPALATISGVTIANGNTTQNGGGIYVQNGKLTLISSVVSNNSAPTGGNGIGYGGGIMLDSGSSLNVLNSTITGNSSQSFGGGIASPTANGAGENITIVNSTISNNTARFGGGVFVSPTTTLTSSNSNFNNNTAAFTGGGIYNRGSAKLEAGTVNLNTIMNVGGDGGGISNEGNLDVSRVGIFSNTATGNGGGISNDGTLTIADSTVSGNQAADGGGINSTSNLTVSRSTISGNFITGNGGGINNSGAANISNSTVSGNQTTGGGFGGGINNADNGTINLSSSTVAFNTNVFRGGGVFNGLNNTVFNVQNTIIAQNTAQNRGPNGLGTFVSKGFNLIGNVGSSGDFIGFTNGTNGDIVGGGNQPVVDPLLDPLANNGGPTQTHALQSASPAIDRGSSGFGIVTDQRGNARFIDAASAINIPGSNLSDIGAYEFAAPTAAAVGVSGRVLTADKRGLRNATVILIDSEGHSRSINTTTFGNFRFTDVIVGETYVLLIRSKSFHFPPQLITVTEEVTDLNLVAE
jgi:hypothetical protein